MGACASSDNDGDAALESHKIDHAIKAEAEVISKTVRLLLLVGAGETGKSTVLKQFKLIYKIGFTEHEIQQFRSAIVLNIFISMKAIIMAMDTLKIPYGFNREQVEQAQAHPSPGESGSDDVPDEIVDALNQFWADPGVQFCFSRSSEYQMIDSCAYFMKDPTRVLTGSFKPTEQDILETRILTTRIQEIKFKIQGTPLVVVDLGGQRSERKKWIPYFSDVQAIIYLVALSSYDQRCFEDNTTNRITESLVLFHSLTHHPALKDTSIILFMNKIDIFKEKLKRVTVSDYFPGFTGPNDYENASKYFDKRFRSENKFKDRDIFTHFTWATDTAQISEVLNAVTVTLLK
ncbi:G-protein alpha i subunit [Chytriomyces sp. MP71]|nr:G-protein alpha i subunit [Chytriomyces sp. MP71]